MHHYPSGPRRFLVAWGCASDGQCGIVDSPSDILSPHLVTFTSSVNSTTATDKSVATLPPMYSSHLHPYPLNLPSDLHHNYDHASSIYYIGANLIDFVPGLWSSLFITQNHVYQTQPPMQPGLQPQPPRIISSASQYPAFVAATVGREFVLLLSQTGGIFAYGSGAYGELGLGTITAVSSPTHIQHRTLHSVKIVAIAAADFHWLALDSTGVVFSCGNNASGQLGLAHTASVNVPTRVTALWPHPVVTIATGDGHSAALTAFGQILCWGSNKHGQLGNSSFKIRVASLTPALVPVPSDSAAPSLSNAMDVDSSDCFTTSDSHLCRSPMNTATNNHFIDVACGSSHTLALRNDGSLISWGSGDNGRLGTRTNKTLYEPTLVSNQIVKLPKFCNISAGERHSVALTEDGRLFSFGDGSAGQIGDGDIRDMYTPVETPRPYIPCLSAEENRITKFSTARCGGFHTLAIVTLDPENETSPIDRNAFSAPSSKPSKAGEGFDERRNRLPKCHVENMLQAKAGLHRFGCTTALLHTFFDTTQRRVDFIAAEMAHIKFSRIFGDDGKYILRRAAAMIRHQAQVASGLVLETEYEAKVFGRRDASSGPDDISSSLISTSIPSHIDINSRTKSQFLTPKSLFEVDSSFFRPSVLNSSECGYLFFIALMNPIYSEKSCISELAEFAALLLKCEEDAREAFLDSISYCDEHVIVTRLIRPLQEVLTDELKGYRRITKNAILAAKALGLCYHGTWRMSQRKGLKDLCIPSKEFYSEVVSNMVNFKDDYERWTESRELERAKFVQGARVTNPLKQNSKSSAMDTSPSVKRARKSSMGEISEISNSHGTNSEDSRNTYSAIELVELPPLPLIGKAEGPFSFCSYSFLLTEEAKFKILRLESQRRMSEELSRSEVSFRAEIHDAMLGRTSLRIPTEHLVHLQYLILYVRRSNIVSDAYHSIAHYALRQVRELRKPLRVIFHGEEGVDEGGLSKEFYQVFMEHILSPDYGMFEYNEEGRYHWFRKDFLESQLSWRLIGIIFGLAAFNSIVLDVQFPPVIYRKLVVAVRNLQSNQEYHRHLAVIHNGDIDGGEDEENGSEQDYHASIHDRPHISSRRTGDAMLDFISPDASTIGDNIQVDHSSYSDKKCDNRTEGARAHVTYNYKASLDDLRETFPSVGNSLKQLQEYDGDDIENVFGLTYEISYLGLFDKIVNVELIEGGAKVAVTKANRADFINRYCEFLINQSINNAFQPFSEGFIFMLSGPFINQLTAGELQTLINGEKILDFSGLRQSAAYEGGFNEKSAVISYLWQVLDEYDEDMKRSFLTFVTGTERAPIGGLGKLKLVVQRSSPDTDRLPTSRTCFNILQLPEYRTRAKLRDRLSSAILNCKGFGLV